MTETEAATRFSSTRQLIKFSNYSVCLTLPKPMMEILGWTSGDQVEIRLEKNRQELVVSARQTNQTSSLLPSIGNENEVVSPVQPRVTESSHQDGLLPIPEIMDEA